MRRELAHEVVRRGEDRGDDVVGDDVIVIEDRFQQLGDGLPYEQGLVCGHGRGSAHGAYASEAIGRAHADECATTAGEARGEG